GRVAVRISQRALVVEDRPSRPPEAVAGGIAGGDAASHVRVGSGDARERGPNQGGRGAHFVSAARPRCRNPLSSRGFALLTVGSPSASTSAASISEGTAKASFPSLLRCTVYLPCAIPVTAKVLAEGACFLRNNTTSSPG